MKTLLIVSSFLFFVLGGVAGAQIKEMQRRLSSHE